jgi:hypothetical protein
VECDGEGEKVVQGRVVGLPDWVFGEQNYIFTHPTTVEADMSEPARRMKFPNEEIAKIVGEVLDRMPASDRRTISGFRIVWSLGRGCPTCRFRPRTNDFHIKLPRDFAKLPEGMKRYIIAHELAHVCVCVDNINTLGYAPAPVPPGLDEDDVRDLLQVWGYKILGEEVEALAVEALEDGVVEPGELSEYLTFCGVSENQAREVAERILKTHIFGGEP